MQHDSSNPRPAAILTIAVATIITGGLLGAVTNAVNGALSPEYFINIMRWQRVEHVWRAAVAQGIFEGLIYGTLFAVIFTLVVAVSSKVRAPAIFAAKYLLIASAVALAGWCLGGVIAIGLAALSPEFYRATFIGVPEAFSEMMRYAWVGGSIWGMLIGAVLSIIIACTLAPADWRRRTRDQ